jgi:hypothetical protein
MKIEIRHELTRSIFRRELHELTRIDSNKDAKAAVLAHYHHGRGGTRPYHEDQRFSVIAKSQMVPEGDGFLTGVTRMPLADGQRDAAHLAVGQDYKNRN